MEWKCISIMQLIRSPQIKVSCLFLKIIVRMVRLLLLSQLMLTGWEIVPKHTDLSVSFVIPKVPKSLEAIKKSLMRLLMLVVFLVLFF